MFSSVKDYKPIFNIPYIIQCRTKEFYVSFNGCDFRCVEVQPPTSVRYKGRCLFVHGYREFAELYIRIMDTISQQGYSCFLFEQRRNGLSLTGSNNLVFTNEYHTLNDLEFFISYNLSIDSTNFHLVGHSMGGTIVLNYLENGLNKDLIKKYVVSSPLILHIDDTNVWKFLFMLLLSFIPIINLFCMQRAPIAKKTKGRDGKDIQFSEKVAIKNRLTTDRLWLNVVNDARVLSKYGTIEEVVHILKRGKKLLKKSDQRNKSGCYEDSEEGKRIFNNVLVCQTLNDPLANVEGLKEYVKDKKCTVNWYDGCKHALFIEGKEVFERVSGDVVKFLNE